MKKTALEKCSETLLRTQEESEKELRNFYEEMTMSDDPKELESDVKNRLQSMKNASANMRKAYNQTLANVDELSGRWSDIERKLNRKFIPAPPTNAAIDLEESRTSHFTRGLNIYKLLWICFIGSFAGVIIELIWCFIRYGYLESRSGLVYGPFNLLYGAGAVALTLALYGVRNHGNWLSFLGGMIVGSALEYFCSWGQEALLGSISWDYSMMPFNLNGRICLLYSVFWGMLGVLWIKELYPRLVKWILKLPDKNGKTLTWLITAFFVVNIVVSAIAVFRWSQRVDGVAASNWFWELIDQRFTDGRMERIYANMVF